jgi:hypothetical protein
MNFEQWLKDNEHIWKAFENQALLIYQRGYRHYSARTIIEFLRHHSALQEKDSIWKINDHITPFLARKFIAHHPHLNGFFELRGMK